MSIANVFTFVLGVLGIAAPAPNIDVGPTAVFKDSSPDPKDKKANEHYLRGVANCFTQNYVLQAALKQTRVSERVSLHAQADPEKWLREHLLVTIHPEESTVRISLPGFRAPEQADIVNGVAEAYAAEEVALRRDLYEPAIRILEGVQTQLGILLRATQERVRSRPNANDELSIKELQNDIALTEKKLEESRNQLNSPLRLQLKERARR